MSNLVKLGLGIAVPVLFSGCASSPSNPSRELAQSGLSSPQAAAVVTERSEEAEEQLPGIPVVVNPEVEKWIKYFSERDRERFQRFLDRGSQYKDVVENILRENGVPAELYYLAMIESGYVTKAKSHASAVGVWQFIDGTGKRYGLQSNYYVDERHDPIRATEAAAKYLKDLYTVFNSWYLAMAAYNAGEHRILGAVMRGKSRDFWRLAADKKIPNETANYVPKFLAALIIGSNPSEFGFSESPEARYPNLQVVEVPSPIHLKTVAATAGISEELLQLVNPHVRRGITPPGSGTYEIWIPEEKAAVVKSASAQLASMRVNGVPRVVATVDEGRHYYRVQRGENLGIIARKHRISVAHLKRLNGLRSNRIYAGARLRVSAKSYHPTRVVRYRVRRGDNLTSIARRFGMSVNRLKQINALNRNRIFVGQTLKIAANDT